jgi:hypothetical protein
LGSAKKYTNMWWVEKNGLEKRSRQEEEGWKKGDRE